MRRLIAAIVIVLSACAPKITADDGAFRTPTGPIYSNAGFDFAQLEGRWHQVAAFSAAATATCQPGGADFDAKDGSIRASYGLCLSGKTIKGSGTITPTGPGRFAITGTDGIGQDWWVLWVDEGYRTMAIGNPTGAFGFILNRGKALPADRLTAAREVLDFNGYAIEKLVVFGK